MNEMAAPPHMVPGRHCDGVEDGPQVTLVSVPVQRLCWKYGGFHKDGRALGGYLEVRPLDWLGHEEEGQRDQCRAERVHGRLVMGLPLSSGYRARLVHRQAPGGGAKLTGGCGSGRHASQVTGLGTGPHTCTRCMPSLGQPGQSCWVKAPPTRRLQPEPFTPTAWRLTAEIKGLAGLVPCRAVGEEAASRDVPAPCLPMVSLCGRLCPNLFF